MIWATRLTYGINDATSIASTRFYPCTHSSIHLPNFAKEPLWGTLLKGSNSSKWWANDTRSLSQWSYNHVHTYIRNVCMWRSLGGKHAPCLFHTVIITIQILNKEPPRHHFSLVREVFSSYQQCIIHMDLATLRFNSKVPKCKVRWWEWTLGSLVGR